MANSNIKSGSSWGLLDAVSLSDAQFMLGDFCLDSFPKRDDLADEIQQADTFDAMKKACRTLYGLVQSERKDLDKKFLELIKKINETA